MAYAIIETGGKQLRVEPGRFYDVERLSADEDAEITIENVLFVENDGEVSIGRPLVEGAVVKATVMRHLRGPKLIVYKMKPKKKTRKKRGHRQELTRLMIEAIALNGKTIAGSEAAVESATTSSPASKTESAAATSATDLESNSDATETPPTPVTVSGAVAEPEDATEPAAEADVAPEVEAEADAATVETEAAAVATGEEEV
jgi:large subunit ribosomal protein L21